MQDSEFNMWRKRESFSESVSRHGDWGKSSIKSLCRAEEKNRKNG